MRRRARGPARSERGYAMIFAVVMIAVLLTIGASTIQFTRSELHSTADQAAHQDATYVAEAGIQRGIAQLAWQKEMAANYTTYAYNGSSESFADGSYTVTIAQDPLFSTDPTRKLITSVGTVANQTAQLVAHVSVDPGTPVYPTPTPTQGSVTTPTPGGNATPTYGPVPQGTGTPTSTQTPGPNPTVTNGVPPGLPTSTPTPSGAVMPGVCENHEILVSYNGTAELNMTAGALGQKEFNGNFRSNGDVDFNTVVTIGNNATGTVYARGNYATTGGSVLSTLTNASLFRGGTYTSLGDGALALHGVTCGALGFCLGVHFGNTNPGHGTQVTIPKMQQWHPDWAYLRSIADVVVTKDSQPFGSWDTASGTWVVGGHSFPAGTTTRYYVDGNVQLSGVSLFRTAAPHIAARGWISMTTLQVLSTGLLSGDVQSIDLIGEKDVMVGRDVLNLSAGTFQAEAVAISTGLGIQLLSAFDHTLNVFAYSELGEVWGLAVNVAALSKPKLCFAANGNSTLAVTGTIASSIRSLN